MSKSLADLFDDIIPEDDHAAPSLAVKLAREHLATALGLPVAIDQIVSVSDLAAYASGSFTPAELRRFEQRLAASPDAAADVASALHMLADVKADAGGKPARQFGTEDFMPLGLADEIEKLAVTPMPVWEQEVRRAIETLLQSARQTSGFAIEVLTGLLPTQSDAWNFPATSKLATRATLQRTVSVQGYGKNDKSFVSVAADRSVRSVRVEVDVRNFPSDQPVPTVVLSPARLGEPGPGSQLNPEYEVTANGMCDFHYQADTPPGSYFIFVLGQDNAITLTVLISEASNT